MMLDRPAPMRELADRLACDRSYATGLADQLAERGLLERVAGEDRRVKLLVLTDAGMALRDQIAEGVVRDSIMLRRLDAEARAELAGLLRRLPHDSESQGEGGG